MNAVATPPRCEADGAIQARVERQLGRPLADAERGLRLTVKRGDGDSGRYQGTLALTVDGETHVRRVDADSCEGLLTAASLIAAVSLDAARTAASSEPLVPPPEVSPQTDRAGRTNATIPSAPGVVREPGGIEPEAEPVGVEPSDGQPEGHRVAARADRLGASASKSPPKSPRNSPRWIPRIGIAGGAALGVLPGLGGILRLHASVGRDPWLFGVAGTYWTPRTERALPEPVTVMLGTAALFACGAFGRRRLRVGPCTYAEAGGMRGRVRAPVSTPQTVAWAAVGAGMRVSVQVSGRLRIYAAADAGVALRRPTFRVQRAGSPHTVFTPHLASGRAWLGAEIALRGRRPRKKNATGDGSAADPDVGGHAR